VHEPSLAAVTPVEVAARAHPHEGRVRTARPAAVRDRA
jgi:hypothetical protein